MRAAALWLTLLTPVILYFGVVADRAYTEALIPAELALVPVQSQYFITTRDVGGLLDRRKEHGALIDVLAGAVANIQNANCWVVPSTDTLEARGVDTRRAGALFFVGGVPGVVVSIRDFDEVASLVAETVGRQFNFAFRSVEPMLDDLGFDDRFDDEPFQLLPATLSGDSGRSRVVLPLNPPTSSSEHPSRVWVAQADDTELAIRIEAIERTITICDNDSGRMQNLEVGAEIPIADASGATSSLNVWLSAAEDAEVLRSVECSLVDVNSRTIVGECGCYVGLDRCNSKSTGGPRERDEVAAFEEGSPTDGALALRTGHNTCLYLDPAEAGLALLAVAVLSDPDRDPCPVTSPIAHHAVVDDMNLRRFANDDTFRAAVRAMRGTRRAGTMPDAFAALPGILADVTNDDVPNPEPQLVSSVGPVLTDIVLSADAAMIDAIVPIDRRGSGTLADLLSPTGSSEGMSRKAGDFATVAISDSAIGRYVSYVQFYRDKFYRSVQAQLPTALRVLIDMTPRIDPVEITAGLRTDEDGIPGGWISFRLDAQQGGSGDDGAEATDGARILSEYASSLFLNPLVEEITSALASAAAEVMPEGGLCGTTAAEWSQHVEGRLLEKLGILTTHAAWDCDNDRLVWQAAALDSVPLETNTGSVVYLSPKLTSDDVARMRPASGDAIDEAGLLNGKYRAVGWYDAKQVIIADRAGILAPLLESEELEVETTSKVTFSIEGRAMLAQIKLYPEDIVRSLLSGPNERLLGSYRLIEGAIEPAANLSSLIVNARFTANE